METLCDTRLLEDVSLKPSPAELEQLFMQKYGKPEDVGWAPRRRFRLGYYLPADIYEATITKLVRPGCAWLDEGGGHATA